MYFIIKNMQQNNGGLSFNFNLIYSHCILLLFATFSILCGGISRINKNREIASVFYFLAVVMDLIMQLSICYICISQTRRPDLTIIESRG
jgi:hypothetical protein